MANSCKFRSLAFVTIRRQPRGVRCRGFISNAFVRAAPLENCAYSCRKTGHPFGIRARQVMMSSHRFAAHLFACAVRCVRCLRRQRPRPDHGHVGASRQLHARQRPAGRGDPGSPHARRHADDLVQGRLGRRDAGQIRPGAFPRASDVQGHQQASGRRIFPDRAADRRQRERLHLDRLHRLFPARAARAAGHG